jgi:signal transduction histidine kinase
VIALVLIALAGTALFGTAAMRFFARIATDIASMRARTLALPVHAAAAAPPPLPTRDDELGDLAASIDALTQALAARERELEIERRNVFNHEKMAALGGLVAGVLGEIGNPIAAIDGHARGLLDATAPASTASAAGGDPAGAAQHAARAILHETARLATVTHDMAALAAPTSTRRELLSLNELVGIALGLLRFDARLRGVEVETQLDHELPAFEGVPDQLPTRRHRGRAVAHDWKSAP